MSRFIFFIILLEAQINSSTHFKFQFGGIIPGFASEIPEGNSSDKVSGVAGLLAIFRFILALWIFRQGFKVDRAWNSHHYT